MAIFTKYPRFYQLDQADCGPACIRMIASYYGQEIPLKLIRKASSIEKTGATFDGLSDASESIGLKTMPIKVSFEMLQKEIPLPCITHWNQNHYVVLYKITNKYAIVGDPSNRIKKVSIKEFKASWNISETIDSVEGHLLLFEPSHDFKNLNFEKESKKGLSYVFKYFLPYKKQIREVVIGLIFGSLLQLILPFLTQSIIDYGVNLGDLNFVYLILIAQIVIFISRSTVELLRSWILLYITRKVNISLVSDFLFKLMALPISFFDSKHSGDIIQRIKDNDKIEVFFSNNSLLTLFGLINILIFGAVLWYYSFLIFLIFFIGSLIYIIWALFFLNQREKFDHKLFKINSSNQRTVFEIINAMQEIKTNGSEKKRRWVWEKIQIDHFNVSTKYLNLEQKQSYGASAINEIKNIVITFISAKLVIDGQLTLGMMLAIQFILGQLNVPLNSLITFLRVAQDAKLCALRLVDVLEEEPEEKVESNLTEIENQEDIHIKDLSFRYGSSNSPLVLEKLSLTIQKGKTTALIGVSGSGKTTLLNLLLKFNTKYKGSIYIGKWNIKTISAKKWRKKCGVVFQNGYIFGDTILANICESEQTSSIDEKKYNEAIKVSNLESFLDKLPHGRNTIIGDKGISISGGEKQRILIARAVYKNPDYIFLDEATSALDANNEKAVYKELLEYCKKRTVLVIAHRLSTVKKADNIIVLDNGKIVEEGNHKTLTELKGYYFKLVKNQLELGK